jgi:hypothetical protein
MHAPPKKSTTSEVITSYHTALLVTDPQVGNQLQGESPGQRYQPVAKLDESGSQHNNVFCPCSCLEVLSLRNVSWQHQMHLHVGIPGKQ